MEGGYGTCSFGHLGEDACLRAFGGPNPNFKRGLMRPRERNLETTRI